MPGAFVSVHLEVSQPAQLSICEAFVYTDQALPIERCPQFRDQPPGSTATYNGKCYSFYSRQPLAFREALAFCRSRGGTLVDESNPALQGFVSWELWRRHRSDSSSQYWMGAVRDQTDRANWKWLSGADVTVSFWNLPTGEQDCARFDGSKGWLWSDTDCDVPLNYICQHQPKACGRPEQPPNSTMISDRGFAVGASVSYACDEGHLLVGPSERTCLETGFYDEFPPVCKSIQCGYPAEIRRGSYSLLNDSVGYLSEVLYTCEPGSRMIGRARLTCDLDERWNGPPPRCEPTQCELLPLVSHAIAEGTGRNVGDLVAYSCHRGYTLSGAPVLTCLNNGLWDRPVPECIEELVIPDSPIPAVTAYKPHPPRQTTPTITTGHSSSTTPARPKPTRPRPFSISPSTTTVRGQDSQERTPVISGNQPTQDIIRANNNNNRQYTNPPVRKPQSPLTVAPSNVLVVARPLDHEDTPVPGPDRLPANNRSEGPLGARLNLGAIVALGAFGGFVLLAAIVTTVVMLVRRNHSAKHYRHRASPDCNTVASFDSSSSESRNGLNRYYRQAWENLHESAGSKTGLKIQDRTAAAGVGGIHSPLRRKETMDEPDGGNGFMHRNGAGMQEKKRHHHHHHHHSSSANGFRQEPHIVANSRREHREHSHKRY
ncbi:uncharacterized protein LOC113374759 [Ctenocephalides felis]|uniref:uncharacterized protein LOC113374759 n=1 Tax=Ctenocephalides felis TaxID=7515 RepID=UPI000E6E55BA|nr:uncharacterized protein LOC113374759 [Ctenocephalides felis]